MGRKTSAPTHKWIARRMGYTESGISRLRSGSRKPTLDTMRTVEQAFGWPLPEQVVSENWAEDFETITKEKYQECQQN